MASFTVELSCKQKYDLNRDTRHNRDTGLYANTITGTANAGDTGKYWIITMTQGMAAIEAAYLVSGISMVFAGTVIFN